ncbi:MAG: glycosyl hydrolase family 28-related protein [Puia sp.]|nr:glycosyl hydrolase family 28-related protein [Puia sp.]
MTKRFFVFIGFLFIGLLVFVAPLSTLGQAEEFYGAFPSWTDLKQSYLAKGDGVTDDTQSLQMALNNLGQGVFSPVLYLPKGVYRITKTLTMKARRCIAIIGEDPVNTIIKWDGAPGMQMLLLNGVAYSEYSRITWDGSSKALVAVAHEWDTRTGFANSGTRHADEIFRDLAVGLKSGANMDAEFSIRRCRFYNCSSVGISLQGWNALDWWIWDCYFEKCYSGVANNLPAFVAGNFHVYRSGFKNSTFFDISLGSSSFFSVRDNISYNSGGFLFANQFSNTSPITIQGNQVYNAKKVPMINLFTKGNCLLLDNTFIRPGPDTGNVYLLSMIDGYRTPPPYGTLIGNRFSSVTRALTTAGGRFFIKDNKYGIKKEPIPEPMPTPFAPRVDYSIFEVNNRMTSDQIQAVIDKAASVKKGLVHFAYGPYMITKTLKIPGGSPVVLYGDGLSSVFAWRGAQGEPVFRVDFPAMASFRNLYISAAGRADGILVLDNDQDGNCFYGEQLMLYAGVRSNLLVNGFSHTDFRFENLHHNYCKAGNSVQVIGTGNDHASLFRIFACVSVNNGNCYSVADKGRILVYDNWSEGLPRSPFVTLRGSGEFTLNGAVVASYTDPKSPLIDIDSFSGKVVFAQVDYNQTHKTFRFSNTAGTAELLNLGTLLASDSTLVFYDIHSPKSRFSLVNNRYNIGFGSYPLPEMGDTTVAFVERMLSTLRNTTVVASKFPPGHTHFTIDRVMIEGGVNNFRVERSEGKMDALR